MTTLKIIVLGCVLAAIAITLKVRLDTPQGPQPLARAIVTTHLQAPERSGPALNAADSANIAKLPNLLRK